MAETTRSSQILGELFADIRTDLEHIESRLAAFSRSDNPLIGEINSYLFAQGGKRLRPALLMLCSRLAGHDGGPDAVLWSALVEIIHTASLVHDDIIDRTDLRRGRETVHARWGANITVLLGDHLYIRAIHEALRTRRFEIIDALAQASEQMIEGELLEYASSGDPLLGEDRYFEILAQKTGSLFAASCRIGGLLGDAAPGLVQGLDEYGMNLGLAFQIIDDLLDYTGRPAELGKPVLTDLREGRITLPVIYAIRRTGGNARSELLSLIEARAVDPSAIERVRDAVVASGAVSEVSAKAEEFIARAKTFLAAAPPSPAAQTLARLADFILERSI